MALVCPQGHMEKDGARFCRICGEPLGSNDPYGPPSVGDPGRPWPQAGHDPWSPESRPPGDQTGAYAGEGDPPGDQTAAYAGWGAPPGDQTTAHAGWDAPPPPPGAPPGSEPFFTPPGNPGMSAYPQTSPTSGGKPSYVPTILVTLFFSAFGLIPAFIHSRMARERGYPTVGYWVAFIGSLAVSFVVAFALFFQVHGTSEKTVAQKGGSVPVSRQPGSPLSLPPPTSPPPSSASTAPPTTVPGVTGQGAAVMTSVAGDLAQSGSQRTAVQNAIVAVEACQATPRGVASVLANAVATRQQLITSLNGLDASSLPQGSALVTQLTAALGDSVVADQDYLAWMQSFGNFGYPCGSDPTVDSNFNNGQSESTMASSAKDTFLSTWNPLAPTYGQPTYQDTGF